MECVGLSIGEKKELAIYHAVYSWNRFVMLLVTIVAYIIRSAEPTRSVGLKSQTKMSDHFDGVMRKYVKDSLEAVDAGNASDEQLQAAEWHYRLRTAAVEAANRQEEREIQAAEDEKRLILRNLEALEQLRAAGVSNQ